MLSEPRRGHFDYSSCSCRSEYGFCFQSPTGDPAMQIDRMSRSSDRCGITAGQNHCGGAQGCRRFEPYGKQQQQALRSLSVKTQFKRPPRPAGALSHSPSGPGRVSREALGEHRACVAGWERDRHASSLPDAPQGARSRSPPFSLLPATQHAFAHVGKSAPSVPGGL